jgi:hypothetical protein
LSGASTSSSTTIVWPRASTDSTSATSPSSISLQPCSGYGECRFRPESSADPAGLLLLGCAPANSGNI